MKLQRAFQSQARACENLGSPFMARLCRLLADRLRPGTPVTDRLFDWPGDVSATGHSVPLRLAGALHRLVLTKADAGLMAAYPPCQADDATLWSAISRALDIHGDTILAWLDSPPQTNEIRRAAVLIAAGNWLQARFCLPFMISELGASGGLNLNWDHFALLLNNNRFGPSEAAVTLSPNWSGPLPPTAAPDVVDRRGVDLRPMDMDSPDDQLRLQSYLWPDQPHRLELTRAAIALPAAPVDRMDAIDWLESRLLQQPEHTLHFVYNTIAWQYFPEPGRSHGHALLQRAGQQATRSKPLAHFAMEADDSPRGAGLTLTLWPGGRTIKMGRTDFHGRWVDWQTAP